MKNRISKERVLAIIASVLSVIVIVVAVLGLLNVIEYSLYITTPMLSVILGIQAYMHWNKNKGVAIFSLCAAVFMIIATIVVLIVE